MFLLLSVFGASAVYLQDKGIANIAKEATETATFATLEHYPLGFILSIITRSYYDLLRDFIDSKNIRIRYA